MVHKNILILLVVVVGLLLLPKISVCQVSLERQVIGSTGNYTFDAGSGIAITSTVGEVVVRTFDSNDLFLTQGFHQPASMLLEQLSHVRTSFETICPDVATGKIIVSDVEGCLPPYNVRLKRSMNGIFQTVDSVEYQNTVAFENLAADTFIVETIGATFCVESDTIVIDAKNPQDCDLRFYSGITPNNDGFNDVWLIDNIEINSPNEVNIFNRWGNLIWDAKNYDNQDVVWKGKTKNGNKLPDATYFFVVKTAGKTYDGWVELTR